jgi:uncharacterized membrane protein YedE/YeeE
MERWSPYSVGIGIGILCWVAFLLSNKPIGCSTAFARTSGIIQKLFNKKSVEQNPYYKQFKPIVDWEWMLVLGIVIGAFVSANLSGQFHLSWVPSTWAASFGDARILRILGALIGGILIGFGARWAGGCTSGHGISGTLQLAVSSWIAVLCFFLGGIVTAHLLFKVLFP